MHTTSCITLIVTEYIYTNKPASFVPRPSHCRLFTMYKNRGERPGQSYHVNDVNVYLGSRGVGSVPGWTWGLFLWCNSKHLPLIVQDERTCGWEMHSFDQGLPLPTLLDYLGRHWRHSCDENGPGLPPLHHHGNRVSSSLFRYMEVICRWRSKTGQWEGLRMKRQTICPGSHHLASMSCGNAYIKLSITVVPIGWRWSGGSISWDSQHCAPLRTGRVWYSCAPSHSRSAPAHTCRQTKFNVSQWTDGFPSMWALLHLQVIT